MPDPTLALRKQLIRSLDWEEAHVAFDKAVGDLAPKHRGARPAGFEHSAWQLLEHMRIAQQDLLDFCVNPRYMPTLEWPDEYWPADPAPSGSAAWKTSLAGFAADREKLKNVVNDRRVDLFARVPTGKGDQTYLRAILLVIDHNAYHLGQLVAVRRASGAWK